jgi:hypothetical protein
MTGGTAMDDATELERLSQGYDDEGDGPPATARTRVRFAPPPAWGWPFAVGVLLGWLVIGWWLWPVAWTDALPVDLTAADRATYVRLVADAYVRRPDAELAAERLASFPAPTLAAVLSTQGADGADPVAAENARQLAKGLAAVGRLDAGVPTAVRATGIVTTTTAPVRGGALQRLTRPSFWLGLVALLALTGLALAVLRQPRASLDDARARAKARRRARLAAHERATGDGAPGETGALLLEDADGSPAFDPLSPDGPPSDTQAQTSATRAAPQRTGRLHLPELPPDDTASVPLPRAPWQRSGEAGLGPGKLDFGGTASVLYDGADEHFYQTWLVYDEREGLSASINIQARKVGSLTSLDVWLYDRDVTGEAASPPKVAVLAQAASQEAHLRALLRDRQILPAVPGAQTVLEVGELSLEVTVTDVAPPPEAGSLKLDRVRLALTPFRYPQRPDDGVGDDAVRPPLQFRRDDG